MQTAIDLTVVVYYEPKGETEWNLDLMRVPSGFVPSKPSEPRSPNVPYQDDLRVAVDRSALSGCDLWREDTFSSSYFFLSDRLKSALTAS